MGNMRQAREDMYRKVTERSEGMCQVCGRMGTEMHHCCSGGGKRKQHESVESIVLLCMECHRGTRGVHGRDGRQLDLKLKRQVQERYEEQGYSETEIRRMMGGKLF